MTLIITSSDRTPIPIEIIGIDVLALEKDEEERFLATFRSYLQQLYKKGIINFQKVEIRGRFSSGQSGAVVFPIMLFTPGLDPTLNHYRVLKYDDTARVEQEATRFNSLVAQRRGTGVPFEEIQWASNPKYPEKSLLGYRDLVAKTKGLKELSTYMGDLTNPGPKPGLKKEMFKALQDVLGTLYEHHYGKSNRLLPVLPEFVNRKVCEIFAEIFPAERIIVIDEDNQDEANCQDYTGFLVGIEAISDSECKKKYLVKDGAQDRFFRVDVITRGVVDDVEIRDFLNSSIEQRLEHRTRGKVTKSCLLRQYINTSVELSHLSGMIDADKLYKGLEHAIECPYWAFHLHHDLNPGNILIVERARGRVQGLLIDYYSFGPGGHLFTDVARLEALAITESVLRLWEMLFQEQDYESLQDRAKNMEEALFSLNPQQPELNSEERKIVDVALEIRRISLNWLTKEDGDIDVNMCYRNYLFARYAFLLSFQELSAGIQLTEKKQASLLFADALRDLIERKSRDLEVEEPLADLNKEIYIDDTDVQKADTFRKTKEAALLVMMFIDMVNSTRILEELGEERFNDLLQEKKAELTAIIERDNTGKVIKDIGDGLLGVFTLPSAATQRALEIQETLASHPTFKVRIGLDMGQVMQKTEDGTIKDVFGRHVNRAARFEALCEAGHVLTSDTVWDSAEGNLKHLEQIAWKKHGSYYLKGFADAQQVYEPYNQEKFEPLTELNGITEEVHIRELLLEDLDHQQQDVALHGWELHMSDKIADYLVEQTMKRSIRDVGAVFNELFRQPLADVLQSCHSGERWIITAALFGEKILFTKREA